MVLGLSARRHPRQDISWIWDGDFEGLAGLVPAPVVCGNRAAELGVPHGMKKVVRIILLVNTRLPAEKIRHQYLGKTPALRPDLARKKNR